MSPSLHNMWGLLCNMSLSTEIPLCCQHGSDLMQPNSNTHVPTILLSSQVRLAAPAVVVMGTLRLSFRYGHSSTITSLRLHPWLKFTTAHTGSGPVTGLGRKEISKKLVSWPLPEVQGQQTGFCRHGDHYSFTKYGSANFPTVAGMKAVNSIHFDIYFCPNKVIIIK